MLLEIDIELDNDLAKAVAEKLGFSMQKETVGTNAEGEPEMSVVNVTDEDVKVFLNTQMKNTLLEKYAVIIEAIKLKELDAMREQHVEAIKASMDSHILIGDRK